jgi:transcriptional regulator with XRE-family HTH domain
MAFTKYTKKQMVQARALKKDGWTSADIAKELDVGRQTVNKWVKGLKSAAAAQGQKTAKAAKARKANVAADKAAGAAAISATPGFVAINNERVRNAVGPALLSPGRRNDFKIIVEALEIMDKSETLANLVWEELQTREWTP